MTRTIAIIGGGIAGLAVSEAIERRSRSSGEPIRALVLEADSKPGGKIRTSVTPEGFVVETGPHGFLDKEPLVFELIDRLGLSKRLVRADAASAKRYIVRSGRLRALPSSPPKFLVSSVLPLHQRLRVLMEPWATQAPGGDETVFDFAARRIGVGAAEVLVDAMVTGIYGGDPKALSLASAFPRMAELEAKYGSLIKAQLAIAKERRRAGATRGVDPSGGGALHSFESGLGALTDALAERSEIRVGFEARSLRRVTLEPGGSASGRSPDDRPSFQIAGTKDTVPADAVVLAAPADVASDLVEPFASDLAAKMREVPYAPIAVVVHGFRKAELGRDLDGFGFLAPYRERRGILGSIWASTVFPAHAPDGLVMLRSMVGGARCPDHLEVGDDELLERVRAELVALMGISPDASPVLERVLRWPAAIPQYTVGHEARVRAADELEVRVPGLFVTGNAFRGVAMIACIVDAERTAERVVAHVSGAPCRPRVGEVPSSSEVLGGARSASVELPDARSSGVVEP